MQKPDSQLVVLRFFEALDALKARRVISGVSVFTEAHGINRRHLWALRKDPSRDIVQLCWLSWLVEDYGVSASWLLTGKGEML